MLPKGLLLLSAGLLHVTVLSCLLAKTFFCRQKPLVTGSRAASLNQGASDCKKEVDLRAVIIRELTLCPPTRAVISDPSSHSLLCLISILTVTLQVFQSHCSLQCREIMKTQIFLLKIQENKREFPTHPQENCKAAVGGPWIIQRTGLL